MKTLFGLIVVLVLSAACQEAGDSFAIRYQDTASPKSSYVVMYHHGNADSGHPPLDTQRYAVNDIVTVSANTGGLSKQGWHFIGWMLYQEPSPILYKPRHTFAISKDTALYAYFANEQVYTVAYTGQGADSGLPPSDNNNYIAHEYAYILGNTGGLNKHGYNFAGWMLNHSDIVVPGQSVAVTQSLVLHPHFSQKPFTIDYRPNGANSGTVPVDTARYNAGEQAAVLENSGNLAIVTMEGDSYRFYRWNDAGDCSGRWYPAGSSFVITQSAVLYACYQPYTIGDTGPAGGTVFYDKGSYSGGWRYLEALPFDCAPGGTAWEQQIASGQYRTTGAVSIDDGQGNTSAVISVLGSGQYAALLCTMTVHNNVNDWYLPSKNELHLLFQNKALLTGLTSFNYWSSTEYSNSRAWCQNFSTGAQNFALKNNTYRVRPIRRF